MCIMNSRAALKRAWAQVVLLKRTRARKVCEENSDVDAKRFTGADLGSDTACEERKDLIPKQLPEHSFMLRNHSRFTFLLRVC